MYSNPPLLAGKTGLTHRDLRHMPQKQRSNCGSLLLTVTRSRSICHKDARPIFRHFPWSHRRARKQPNLRQSMLGKRSHRESIGRQSWRIVVRIMPVILLVAALMFTGKKYVVEETLVVLFLVAVSTGTILVIAVAFLLLQEGIRRAVQWTKIGLVRPAHPDPQEQ
jgi:hypothetical protein